MVPRMSQCSNSAPIYQSDQYCVRASRSINGSVPPGNCVRFWLFSVTSPPEAKHRTAQSPRRSEFWDSGTVGLPAQAILPVFMPDLNNTKARCFLLLFRVQVFLSADFIDGDPQPDPLAPCRDATGELGRLPTVQLQGHHSHQLQCERRPLEQGVCSAGTPHLMWPFPEPRYGQMVHFRPRKIGCLHQPGLSKPKFVSLLNKLLSSIDGQCTAPPAPSPHLWKITELFQRYEKHSHQILRLQSEITQGFAAFKICSLNSWSLCHSREALCQRARQRERRERRPGTQLLDSSFGK